MRSHRRLPWSRSEPGGLAPEVPGARSVLDIGCGTGEHARHLVGHGYAVDGLDIESSFVELAQVVGPYL